jgi:formylglycine-generating enzyme required for sulfatase activity
MSSSVAESHIDAFQRCHGVRWVYLSIMELALNIRCRKSAMAVLLATASAFGEGCPGDLDTNGMADGADLGILLSSWGASGGTADIDQDGVVDGADLGILLSSWGPCVSVPEWGSLIEAMPDPEVIYDAGIRQAIIATGSAWRVRDNLTGMEMILVPGGSFQMGCPTETGCYADEYPLHPVTISSSFYIGRYEVTQAQWVARMNYNPSYFQPPQFPGSMDRPVDWVSWNNIQSFLSITGMNLPTEAQWEYAARAGTTTTYHGTASQPGGSDDPSILPSIAWHGMAPGDPVYGTQVGGLKLANGFGLHDMTGNVWEWVRDRYAADYYSYSPVVDPTGPASGGYRPIRGGGCGYDADSCRISARGEGPAAFAHGMIGFRVIRPNDQ